MGPLVLIGLALIASGIVLLCVVLGPRLRQRLRHPGARPAARPRTVADLVRLRSESGEPEGATPTTTAPTPTPSVPSPRTAAPVPQAARTASPVPRAASVAAAGSQHLARGAQERSAPAPVAAAPPAPAPAEPRLPTPHPPAVATNVEEPSAPEAQPAQSMRHVHLDGDDDAPWQRAARIAAGLGDGRPWQEAAPVEPAPVEPARAEPAPLRLVRSAELAGPTEVAVPVEGVTPPEDVAPVAAVLPVEAASATAPPAAAVAPEVVAPEAVAPEAVAPEERAAGSEPIVSEHAGVAEQVVEPEQAAGSEPAVVAQESVQPPAAVQPVMPVATAEPAAAEASAAVVEPAAVEAAARVEGDEGTPEPPIAPPSAAAPAQEWTPPPPVVPTTAEPVASVEPRSQDVPASAEPRDPVEAAARPDEHAQAEPGFPTAAAAGALGLAAAGAAWATARPQADPEPVEYETAEDWEDPAPEVVPTAAVPERFAEASAAQATPQTTPAEATDGPPPAIAQQASGRSVRTPDERAAEQAAADLALLRTFGFADPGLRPDQAPVVAMARPDEEAGATAAGEAQPVRYRAVHRDATTVAGAAVTLLDDRGGDVAAGTADADGRGEVLAPAPGGYVLVSTAPGHLPGAVAITVTTSPVEADVLLARAASVSGAVHGEDGPVAGARVTLVQDGEVIDATDTDADGGYRIGDIGAGEYGLSVAAPGCQPTATMIDIVEEADLRNDVALTPASPVADADPATGDVMSGYR
ncbi:carboxypeptidase-like regulatory domain-containing protein [Pseudonocardia sp. MH-G8]|uniref:carboxypeptidase-like regulatory domain-containing protein n=1 Tax=Pseudonocardia sp. MH-G8 TaxID=1854588 RepID=UPI000BA01161|nr:carboxypeptidase-like regulatory domain-containing protein [Pseudonocardia sp. MH-G8]OZM84076.1 hypothetical protein CFP66_06615 [Pseudonocardia sp. MH-G8]